jgi:hypothetical protein
MEHYDTLLYWVTERHSIYLKKEEGLPKPWTADPILQNYRFCNPYRENDKVTVYIAEHWRTPNRHDPDLWFAMTVARLLNLPSSMDTVGYPVPFDKEEFLRKLKHKRSLGHKIFNAAYIVSTNGVAMDKLDYIAERVLTPLWRNREYIRPRPKDCLQDVFERLTQFDGIGSFIAGQIIADIKYAPPLLLGAGDWSTFAVPGPGSLRGMRRLYGLAKDDKRYDKNWRFNLLAVKDRLNTDIPGGMSPLHAQDVQNCLCEFDKYMRVWLGEGVPKQKYNGRYP